MSEFLLEIFDPLLNPNDPIAFILWFIGILVVLPMIVILGVFLAEAIDDWHEAGS